MAESLFTFLFKYRPAVFQEGELALGTPLPLAILLGCAALGLVVLGSLHWAREDTTRGTRGTLALLRGAALTLLVVALLRPVLVLSSVVPQRNFVGVLFDDSRSMAFTDEGEESRATTARAALGPGSPVVDQLSERFSLRWFRFSDAASRIGTPDSLSFDETRTDLAAAIRGGFESLSGLPLSGLVVVSDGADNGRSELAESLLPLQAEGIPVFTVGVGGERFDRDLQVGRVDLPPTVLAGTSLLVDVPLTWTGLGGSTVPVEILDGSAVLAREEIALPRGEDAGITEGTVARLRVTLDETGLRRIRVRVPVQEGERVEANNRRDFLVRVDDRTEKILYYEGEPRYEVKFLRRAVREDPNLQVVVLQRTAENKYLRLDVDSADELEGGFPRTRDELFRYRALVLGSVEASDFTRDQLEMIADFVSERGGGLLVLGGRRSLGVGGYAGTAVADALPVILEEGPEFDSLTVAPTRIGADHPATRIHPDPVASAERWPELPFVTSVNAIREVKPGATTLLVGAPLSDPDDERVVLAYQRYGRGRSAVFPVQDSWIWQMHSEIAPDDRTHEAFWTQLLRWLVDEVPQRLAAEPVEERVEPGETAGIRARVRDARHLAVNDARPRAVVTTPEGTERVLPLEWAVEEDGLYTASFEPTTEGVHEVRVEVPEGDSTAVTTTGLIAGPSDREAFDAAAGHGLLRRIAEETGGRFYRADDLGGLPEDLQVRGAGITVTEERELWDMPIVFFLLVGLLGAEWVFRRTRGLA